MRIGRTLGSFAVAATAFGFSHSAAFAQAAPPLFAVLLGGNEISSETGEAGAGDLNGRGSATVLLRGTTVCFGITVNGIGTPTLAHIHNELPGKNGPIVVNLVPPTTGNPGASSGCVENVDAGLVGDILRRSSAYYVNIHNEQFPAGALRGQLF
jgi:hypothetical protein